MGFSRLQGSPVSFANVICDPSVGDYESIPRDQESDVRGRGRPRRQEMQHGEGARSDPGRHRREPEHHLPEDRRSAGLLPLACLPGGGGVRCQATKGRWSPGTADRNSESNEGRYVTMEKNLALTLFRVLRRNVKDEPLTDAQVRKLTGLS